MKILTLLALLFITNISYSEEITKDYENIKNVEAVGKLAEPTPSLEQLCIPNYTKTIRPPTSYTNALKRKLFKEYNLTGNIKDYELDHKIPLVLGGDPKSEDNLWMEIWSDAHKKDIIEVKLHKRVCKKEITLEEAQKIMFDWVVE